MMRLLAMKIIAMAIVLCVCAGGAAAAVEQLPLFTAQDRVLIFFAAPG
jgi:hypothetical protein